MMYETNKLYCFDPSIVGFEPRDVCEISPDKYLYVGAQKTVRLIEGPNRREMGTVSLYMNCKKTAFYTTISLVRFISAVLGYPENEMRDYLRTNRLNPDELTKINEALVGLYVSTRTEDTVDNMRKVIKVSHHTADELKFGPEGAEVTLRQYHAQRYGDIQ